MNNNRIKILLLILSVFFISNTAYSQKFRLGPIIGLTAPTGDYSGTTMEYYAGTRYGMNSGVNFGALFKAGMGPFNLRVSATYAPLSNTGQAEPGEGFIDVKSDLLSFSIGPEFELTSIPTSIKPYLGADLLISSISGRTTFTDADFIPDGTYDMQSATRIGLGLGGGFEYGLGTGVLDIGIRYNLINLFGKKFEDVNPTATRRLDSYLSLNDDPDPLAGSPTSVHPISTSRSISVIQVNVSYLFGF
ncbi:MAG TPA: outer membrane beta-barrel protein [Ignavibacteria bacterium]|nr:outer membrane beta-barrel protein [Ignavibacteria bacterium]